MKREVLSMVGGVFSCCILVLFVLVNAETLTGVDLMNNGQTVITMQPQGTALRFNGLGLPDQILTRVEYLSLRTSLKPLTMLAASYSLVCQGTNPCEPMACLCANHATAASTKICSCLSVAYDPTQTNNKVNCYLATYTPSAGQLTSVTPCTPLVPPPSILLPLSPIINLSVYWDQWTADTSTPPQYYPAAAHFRPTNTGPASEITYLPAAGALLPSTNSLDFGWSALLVMHTQVAPLLINNAYFPNVTSPVYLEERMLYHPYEVKWSAIYNPYSLIFRKPDIHLSVIDPNGQTYTNPMVLSNSDRYNNLRMSRFRPSINCRVLLQSTDEYGRLWAAVSSPFQVIAAQAEHRLP